MPRLFYTFNMTIQQQYQNIKEPTNFIKHFKSDKEFIEWCREGTIQDLYCTLEAFKQEELYEHCVLISNVIREKKNE